MVTQAQAMINKAMSEKAFQRIVIDAAIQLGWLVYHVPDSRLVTSKGYCDLSLIHPKKHLFLMRELKTERGRLRPEQIIWIEALVASGVNAKVWRPSNWNEIEETLKAS